MMVSKGVSHGNNQRPFSPGVRLSESLLSSLEEALCTQATQKKTTEWLGAVRTGCVLKHGGLGPEDSQPHMHLCEQVLILIPFIGSKLGQIT
jgi:hypothetical protein